MTLNPMSFFLLPTDLSFDNSYSLDRYEPICANPAKRRQPEFVQQKKYPIRRRALYKQLGGTPAMAGNPSLSGSVSSQDCALRLERLITSMCLQEQEKIFFSLLTDLQLSVEPFLVILSVLINHRCHAGLVPLCCCFFIHLAPASSFAFYQGSFRRDLGHHPRAR